MDTRGWCDEAERLVVVKSLPPLRTLSHVDGNVFESYHHHDSGGDVGGSNNADGNSSSDGDGNNGGSNGGSNGGFPLDGIRQLSAPQPIRSTGGERIKGIDGGGGGGSGGDSGGVSGGGANVKKGRAKAKKKRRAKGKAEGGPTATQA